MIIAGKEVDDELIGEYVEQVRHMIERSRKLPSGVQIHIDDRKCEELHDKLLDQFNETKGSSFDMALRKYVEELGSKEGWYLTWDDLP